MFEGVSRDDVNYNMLVYCTKKSGKNVDAANAYNMENDNGDGAGSEGKEVNNLLLIYPNGIICIYEDVLLSSGRNRKKSSLKKVIKSDYPNMLAPQIFDKRILFMSNF